ncbi:MAG: recombinase family protein [Kordiimonadaceae bacterium]|nr:recombinase family protein [Kordiimonadaceae bacterium]
MSTDHQRYSTENQTAAIRKFAAAHGMQVVQTFCDSGKSGLVLEGRDSLKNLIHQVSGGACHFEAILVYDISRWGRFQDPDEAAYLEYICKRGGLAVHYCAEQFDNDGSPVSTIIKNVKRAMAGELSRELSIKVFTGQCRLVELGFRQGGPAGYGLRRMLIDEFGNQKQELARGQHKSLQTDRVILVPGPQSEVQVVNEVYRSFVKHCLSEQQIADWLNSRGIKTDIERPWTRGSVHQLLVNEKYIGHNVFNRSSFKLKKRRVTNEPDKWIRAENAFEAIVGYEIFNQAQKIIIARSVRLTDEEMIAKLKILHARHGYLSGLIIDETDGLPSSGVFRHRFGSLLRAYQQVGYTPDRDYRYIAINQDLRRYHSTVIEAIIENIRAGSATATLDPMTDLLTVNNEFTASLVVARYQETKAGSARWKIRFDIGLKPDITIAVRMDCLNEGPIDYYILPRAAFSRPAIRLAEQNGISFDCYRFQSLDYLFLMAERRSILEFV